MEVHRRVSSPSLHIAPTATSPSRFSRVSSQHCSRMIKCVDSCILGFRSSRSHRPLCPAVPKTSRPESIQKPLHFRKHSPACLSVQTSPQTLFEKWVVGRAYFSERFLREDVRIKTDANSPPSSKEGTEKVVRSRPKIRDPGVACS